MSCIEHHCETIVQFDAFIIDFPRFFENIIFILFIVTNDIDTLTVVLCLTLMLPIDTPLLFLFAVDL
jgi:hypothetical protein